MNSKFPTGELIDGCRRYVRLPSNEQDNSDLFKYWDYLFFELATESTRAPEVWNIIKNVVGTDLSKAQLALIAAGPFEEMLASLQTPMPQLFESRDLPIVRSLAEFVWPGRVKADVYNWVRMA